MSTHPHAVLRALLPFALASCAYTSDYVAPADGRARVVWQGGDPVALVPGYGEACRASAIEAAQAQVAGPTGGCGGDCGVIWIHHAPVVELPVPVLHLHPGPIPARGVHAAGPVVGGTHPAGPVRSKPSPGDLSSLGKGADELWIAAAVAALATMPLVATGLALANAEDAEKSAGAIDLVNTFNDLARTPGSACAPPPLYPEPALEAAPLLEASE